VGDVGGGRGRGKVGFDFTEDAVERCAWEPNKVTSCVHVECYRLGVGTEGEGESVVGAW
jgi:hypothetical protein